MIIYYLINIIIFILCTVAYKKDDFINFNISFCELIFGLELYEFIYYITLYYDEFILEEIKYNNLKKIEKQKII